MVSIVDFAIAFVGIDLLGVDYISPVAASVKAWVLGLVYSQLKEPGQEEMEDVSGNVTQQGQEGLYTMLVLMYMKRPGGPRKEEDGRACQWENWL